MEKTRSKPPSLRFLFTHPAHLIACGFGSGLAPTAPGTAGTVFAWISFLALRAWMNDPALIGFLAICLVVGVAAIHKTGADLGVVDHGSIVWDEIVPFWMVLFYCPDNSLWQAAAFGLFRFFDIVKPQPAKYFDRNVKNGFGVMADDLVAAAYTVLTLALCRYVFA